MGTQETTLMVNYFLTGDLGKQQQGALSSYSKDIVSLQRTGEVNSDAAQRLQETLGKGMFYLVTLPDKDVTFGQWLAGYGGATLTSKRRVELAHYLSKNMKGYLSLVVDNLISAVSLPHNCSIKLIRLTAGKVLLIFLLLSLLLS